MMLSAYAGLIIYAPDRNSNAFIDVSTWKMVCRHLGVSSESGESNVYRRSGYTNRAPICFVGLRIAERYLRLKRPAVCPICVEGSKYLPNIWDCRLLNACPRHQVALVDRCPECDRQLGWNRKRLASCMCGMSLAQWPRRSVSPGCAQAVERIFAGLNQKELDEAVAMLDVLKLTFEMATHPPGGAGESSRDARFVELAFDKSKQLEGVSEYVTQLSAQGIHPRLALAHFLASKRSSCMDIASEVLNESRDVNSPARDLELHDLSLEQAAGALGLSSWLSRQLIKEGILAATRKGKRGRYSVSAESTNKLLGLLNSRSPLSGRVMTIGEYLNKPETDKRFSEIVKEVISGEQPFAGGSVSEGMKGIRISVSESPRLDHCHMKIAEVSELCDCNYENIRLAVHAGILKRVEESECRGTTILIRKDEAEQFHSRFAFAGSIARQLGRNPTNVAEKLMAQGVQPVSGPGIDGGLTYLFRRVDLESLDLRSVFAMSGYPTRAGRNKGDPEKPRRLGCISISEAAVRLGVPYQAIEGMVKRDVFRLEPALNREKYLTEESVQHVLDMLGDSSYTRLATAAAEVDETPFEFNRRWVQTSFVEIVDVGLDRLVSRDDLNRVVEFKRLHISASDAARTWNVGRTHFTNLEKQSLLEPSTKFTGSRSSVKFYLRSDVERVLAVGAT